MKISYYLPEKVLYNAELAALYTGWTEEKIAAKTGIISRHVTVSGETALDLAEHAARKLFSEYEIDVSTVDFTLFRTQSPDYKLPSSACILQSRLDLPTNSGALDYNLGCSGFVYGLALAKSLVAGGVAKNVLLLTGETYTKYIHPLDKSVRTIFGDGAAAVLVDGELSGRIGKFVLGTDGSGAEKLIVRTGGAREAVKANAQEEVDVSGNVRTCNHISMSGPEIFNFTLDVVPQTMEKVCAANGVDMDGIDLFVFHQANKFMLDTIRKVNMIPRDKFYVDMEDVGNTVSSTIPIALARAMEKGVLRPGMNVMIMGFGVGLSWGATIIRF